MSDKLKLLDLCCGIGGATRGYQLAGFYVVGIDVKPQPHYCGDEFYQADALTYPLDGFDAYHSSPPCQRFSQAVKKVNREKHPDLIQAFRDRFKFTGKPYVIENVPRAPLKNPFTLCGSSFGLAVRRHRKFESNIFIPAFRCSHTEYPRQYNCAWNRTTKLRVLSISGGYQHGITLNQYKEAMGIDWEITRQELSQAIPPAYTRYIGEHLLRNINNLPLP